MAFEAIFLNGTVILNGSLYPVGHFSTECCNYDFSAFIKYEDLDELTLSSDFELFDKAVISSIEYFKRLDVIISDFPLIRDLGVKELSGLIETFELKHMEAKNEMATEAFHDKWNRLTAEGHYPSYLSSFVDLCGLCAKIAKVIDIISSYKTVALGALLSDREYSEDISARISDLKKSELISLIPQLQNRISFSVEYKIVDLKEGSRLTEVVAVPSWADFIYMDFFRALINNHFPRPCKNCARYFLIKPGYNYRYCNNVAPGEISRTCRNIGASRVLTKKTKQDPILMAYGRAYKKYYARKRKGTLTMDFDEWTRNAVKLRSEAEAGKILLEEFVSRLNSV